MQKSQTSIPSPLLGVLIGLAFALSSCKLSLIGSRGLEDPSATISTSGGGSSSHVSIVKPVLVQSTTISVTAQTFATLVLPRPTTAGNFLLVGVGDDLGFYSVTGISDDAASGGNVYVSAGAYSVGEPGFDDRRTEIWYSSNIKGGATAVTVNFSANTNPTEVWVLEFWGVAKTNPLASVATGADNAPATVAAPTVTTTTENALVFSLAIVGGTVEGLHSPNPFVDLPTINGNPAGYYVATAPGTYGGEWDQGQSYVSSTAAFKAGTLTEFPLPTKLAFQTAPKVVSTSWNCTGLITVEAQLADGTPAARDTAIPITPPGNIEFYADASCDEPLASVEIPAGRTSTEFSIRAGTIGVSSLTTGATGLSNASQSLTVVLRAPYTWIGGAVCGNGVNLSRFTSGPCWEGGSAPGPFDQVHFDDSCTSNCSPSITGAVDVGDLLSHPGYAGTLALGTHALSVNGDFRFHAGTFDGGSGAIDIDGGLMLVGGSFKSTSGALTLGGVDGQGTAFSAYGTANFNPAGGTVIISPNGSKATVLGGPVTFNDVTFAGLQGSWWGPIEIKGRMNVGGNLLIANEAALNPGDYGSRFMACYADSEIAVSGNVTVVSGEPDIMGQCSNHHTKLRMVGSGVQTLTGGANSLPGHVIIDSTGTVNLAGTIDVALWSYERGTVNAGASTVRFVNIVYNLASVDSGTMRFNDVVIGGGFQYWFAIEDTMRIAGDLTVDIDPAGGNLYRGTIELEGNLSWRSGSFGLGNIVFKGGNAQTFTLVSGNLGSASHSVQKTAGTTLTLNGNFVANEPFTISSGIVSLNGNTLSTPAQPLYIDGPTAVLQCNGGCGAGTACGQGPGLVCGSLNLLNGGSVVP